MNDLTQVVIDEKSFNSKKQFKLYSEFFSYERYWNDINALPDFKVEVNRAWLRKKAKLTDVMSYMEYSPSIPFLVNRRVKDIFGKFKLKGINFYPAKIFFNDKKVDDEYFLLHSLIIDYDGIDFKNSILVKDIKAKHHELLKVNNLEEYKKSRKDTKHSRFKKLVIKKRKLFNQHFINTKAEDIFISKELRDVLLKEKVSGINIEKSNILEIQ